MTATSGCLLIRSTALRVPQVNERGSPLPGSEPREPQRNSGETLPFGLTLPSSPGILQKLRVRGKGGTEDLRHSRSQASCRPASVHAQPRRWRRRCTRELGIVRPPRVPGGHPPGWVPGNASPRRRRHNLPRISCPWWRPQASLYFQLPNSWWLFQRKRSKCSHKATSKRSANPEGVPPPGRGWSSSQDFLMGGWEEEKQMDPRSDSTNLQEGLEPLVVLK